MCSGLETYSQYLQRHNETVDFWLISWCVLTGLETCSQYLQRHNDTVDYW